MATMKDVAGAAGVSIATVSATLSGAAYVSPELKARVNAAIDRLGYQPNRMASSLKRGRTSLIGLVVSDITNPFFTELVHCIQSGAQEAGYSVLLGVSGHDAERERELLRLMRAQQAAATIFCPAGSADDYGPERLQAGPMKLVAADNISPDMGCDAVGLDNRKAARLAAEHILSFGHTRIGMVAGSAHQHVGQERLAGFRSALQAAGVGFEPERVEAGSFRIEEAQRACKVLLARPSPPTALFVANNLMLIGVMQALAEAGLRVPEDISVASIDDFPWAAAFQPALTVVRQPIEAMAAAALGLLLKRLEEPDAPPAERTFEPELVVRRSCAPPHAN
ncbi:MAG: LacI family DNA-binding transcriptional regulator [Parafilimonas terrae]|nr:LacI family DNA-binding transcriptional regulator [Parafilimonas terrae]